MSGYFYAKREILPTLPIVFGLAEPEASASVGVSVSKFRALVADGRMPKPRRIDSRLVYDVDELRAAFKSLPHQDEAGSDTWRTWGEAQVSKQLCRQIRPTALLFPPQRQLVQLSKPD